MTMLSVAAARAQILAATPTLASRPVPLAECLDAVLAGVVVAPLSLPAWDNSAVDGYAVSSSDVASASENNPIHLHVTGEIPAGRAPTAGVEPLTCQRIFTGAPLPSGADAVVMQEDTRQHHEGYVAVLAAVEPGENIRRAGEDIAAGSVALRAGTVVGPAQLALAAALGCAELPVHRRPRVGVLMTGAELVEPGQPLATGQIYDSSSYALCAWVRRAGSEPVELGIADDTRDDLLEKIDYGLSECDAVITVGGVSVGEYDLVKQVLADAGCEQQFWKVAMRPGRPFVFGTRAGKLAFGLPGNPVSAAVTFLLLVRPALQKLRGNADVELPGVDAEVAAEFVNRGDRVHYMRARLEQRGGRRFVTPLPGQGSHMLSSLADANCLVEVAENATVAPGSQVWAIHIP
jgi:molybdopterin molybdotransferase